MNHSESKPFLAATLTRRFSRKVRFCTYNGWDKFDLKKQMQERNIPMLELDLEYGHPAGAQVRIRAEAFMEMLETRVQ